MLTPQREKQTQSFPWEHVANLTHTKICPHTYTNSTLSVFHWSNSGCELMSTECAALCVCVCVCVCGCVCHIWSYCIPCIIQYVWNCSFQLLSATPGVFAFPKRMKTHMSMSVCQQRLHGRYRCSVSNPWKGQKCANGVSAVSHALSCMISLCTAQVNRNRCMQGRKCLWRTIA